MSKRSPKVFIEDILTSVEKIERYIQNIKSYDEFVNEEIVADAVIRNLEIIGEAARNLPNEIYEKYPKIPWKNIIGLRNIVAHGYFVVDLEIIWTIVTEQITKLRQQLKDIVKDLQ